MKHNKTMCWKCRQGEVCELAWHDEKLCAKCLAGEPCQFAEKKKNKYGAKRTEVMGITFDSKREAKHFEFLKLAEFAIDPKDRVKEIELQPVFKFACGVTYKADFKVTYGDGRVEIQDVKGVLTDVYKIKKKLLKHEFGIDVVEIK